MSPAERINHASHQLPERQGDDGSSRCIRCGLHHYDFGLLSCDAVVAARVEPQPRTRNDQ